MLVGGLAAGLTEAQTAKPPLPELGAAAVSELSAPGTLPKTPLGLEQLIQLAFERNPNLRAAAERIGEAQARLTEASAAFYPQLAARVGYQRTNDPSRAFAMIVAQRRFTNNDFLNINNPADTSDFRPELLGTMSLYHGGQDYEARKAAELGIDVAALERLALRNDLAEAVTAAYFTTLAAQEQIKVVQQSLVAVAGALKYTEARYAEGAALKADKLSLDVRMAEAWDAEIRAKNSVALALTSLKTLLGVSDAVELSLTPPAVATVFKLDGSLNERRAQALARRAEVQGAVRRVRMREHELKAAQGANLPRVNAFATYGQNTPDPDFSLRHDNFTVGIAAEVDLFTGQRNAARIQAARQRLAEAQALEQQARLNVEAEVKKGWLSLEEALARIAVADMAANAADEALRLVRERYEAGAAPITRYLEAEVARSEAQTRAVTTRFEASQAQGMLDKAVGRWNE